MFASAAIASVIVTSPGCGSGTSVPTSGYAVATNAPSATSTALSAGTVRTDTGTFAGTTNGNVEKFLGIPYAQPPIGKLRWMPPQPLASIAPGVTNANAFKPPCFAKPSESTAFSGQPSPASPSEDCLYLNVYAPADLGGSKPVDVWFYGGAYSAGYADPYDGTPYANRGIVYVNFDYRVGIFGFFAHPGLDALSPHHTSGNQGILDQIAVLNWVHRNIAAFGGDPNNVTIHGESAGAGSVEAQLVSPLSSGLFKRAIAESPFIGQHPAYTTAQAETYFAANGYGASLDSLQAIDANSLSLEQPKNIFGNGVAGPYAASQCAPYVDGYVLPAPERQLFSWGAFNHADLIAGNCDNEGLFVTQTSYAEDETPMTFGQTVDRIYGNSLAAQAEALYPAPAAADDVNQLGQLFADPIFNYDARQMARAQTAAGQQVWRYVYTRPEPGQLGPDTHGCEIPFVYSGLTLPASGSVFADAGAAVQSALVIDALTRFMKAGNPNGGMINTWPRYTAAEPYLEFADAVPIAHSTPYRQAQLDLVDSYLNSLPTETLPTSFLR